MRLAWLVVLTVFAHAAFNGSRVSVSLFTPSLQGTPLFVGALVSLYSFLPVFFFSADGKDD